MNKTSYFFVFILFSLTIICSCSGNSEKSRKPVTTVELTPKLKYYRIGESVSIKIQTKLRNGKLRKTVVYLNDKILTNSDQTEITISIPRLEMIGVNTLRIISEKSDGISNTRIFNFNVLSDVKPKKYAYNVIREFSHSTDHFTQGFEIHDDFMYEGTGENGKSAIYKININTGKVISEKTLADKYFGEGITILNNKLYQLTYKHQIGFVYNLSDFAVIDSFRYQSEEGWGLTNDGTFLIMSDGTATLTWIDPQTYNVVKKVQVSDNENVYQNLNELEYDNGNIWANIWMTNKIVSIDAEKGNIKGIINLDNIMSVMSQNKGERIDVLNGIALYPHSGNLLVTGKLWPKIFEIKVNISE
jgi:glutaminyl-peptide cyclotransferase